jgi:uncharacterized protein
MSFSLSEEALETLLRSRYIGHLGCCLDNQPYVVPITYYYDAPHNSLIGYTSEGHKVEVMRQNPHVCVEISEVSNLSHWESAIVEGQFEELHGKAAMDAIQTLITKLEPLINEEGKQQVEQIRDMARANEANPKVIYRIHIHRKSGRYEAGDIKLDI